VPEEIDSISPFRSTKGIFYLIVKALTTGMAAALFFILIARVLPSISDLGLYQGLQSLITVGVTLAGSGLSRAATRFISLHIGSGKDKLAQATFSAVFRVGLIGAIGLSLALYGLAPYIAYLFFHDLRVVDLIRLTSVDVFLFSLVICLTSLMYTLQWFREAVTISVISSLFKFGIASLFVATGGGVEGIIIGFILGDAVGLVMYLHALLPHLRIRPAAIRELKPLLAYTLPLYGYSILVYLSTEIDLYILLILSDLEVVGIYSPAVFLSTMLILGLTAVDQAIAPFFSRRYGKSGMKALVELSSLGTRYIFLIYIPTCVIVLSCTPLLFTEILGDRYSESIYPATIIIIAIISTSAFPIFNNILISAGQNRVFFIAGAIALLVQVTLSLILIPSMGATGAAIAKASAFLILFLIPAYRLKLILGALLYDRKALLRSLIGSVIMGSIIFTINLNLFSAYLLPISIIAGVVSYLLCLRASSAVNLKDIEVINKSLPASFAGLTRIVSKLCVR
jgi:O-antigen/teichoic acid export membrane protein